MTRLRPFVSRHARAGHHGRAFSLIEVLLAIFILGIGVISIAALFPAGIAQQRLSVDDMMGPIVADSAISVIRGKVKADDFGNFEALGGLSARFTIPGDWSWGRPMLFRTDATVTPPGFPSFNVKAGSISIFKIKPSTLSPNSALTSADEIPWNAVRYGGDPTNPPSVPIIITQRERYFPMASDSTEEAVRPQYVWDCMFRRFGGKIMVAIFVYRVTVPGGGTAPNYRTAEAPSPCENVPALPIHLNFINNDGTSTNWSQVNQDVCAGGPWSTFSPTVSGTPPPQLPNNAIVLGTQNGVHYNPDNIDDGINTVQTCAWARQAWQQSRQWILDQNNNIYRVVGQSRTDYDNNVGEVLVELTRPVASMPDLPQYFLDRSPANSASISTTHVVTDIWYLPTTDANGLTLTPVYATVKEL